MGGTFTSKGGINAQTVYIPKVLSIEAGYAALGSLIARGESGGAAYRAYTKGPNFNRVSPRAFEDITKLNVGQIMRHQQAGELGAVGKYQIIYTTLAMAVGAGVLDKTERKSKRVKFNKAIQDKLYRWIIEKKRPEIGAYLQTGKGMETAQIAMAKEWAALGVPIAMEGAAGTMLNVGESYYKGVGDNKARILPGDIMNALNNLRLAIMGQKLQASNNTQAAVTPAGDTSAAAIYGGDSVVTNIYHDDSWMKNVKLRRPNEGMPY